jgi:hypothetical protein
VLARTTHALAEITPCARTLGDQDTILFDPSSSYHELRSDVPRGGLAARRHGARLDRRREAHGATRARHRLLPRSALNDELADGSLAQSEVSRPLPVRRQIVAIRRARCQPGRPRWPRSCAACARSL